MKVTLRQRSGVRNEVPRRFDVTKEGGATIRQDPTVAKLSGKLRDIGHRHRNVEARVEGVLGAQKKASCEWTQDAFFTSGRYWTRTNDLRRVKTAL